jgi:hypothetical protein
MTHPQISAIDNARARVKLSESHVVTQPKRMAEANRNALEDRSRALATYRRFTTVLI